MGGSEFVVTLGDQLYAVERPWGSLPEGLRLGFVSDVAVDSAGRVYVAQRVDPPVIVFDADGAYLRSWGSGVIADAHGIYVTPDDLVLVVDRDAHQVLGFDPDGTPRLTIGQRHLPAFGRPFNHPTDVAVAPSGEFYVTDGYGNSHVHVFAPDGRWLRSWGRPGSGPGEFMTPHAVWVDSRERVLVVDRDNNRVQIFSPEGEFLAEWGDTFHPMDLWGDAADRIYISDQIPRLDRRAPDGTLLGRCKPIAYGAHGICGDARGNIYLAEQSPMDRITRLSPIPPAEGSS